MNTTMVKLATEVSRERTSAPRAWPALLHSRRNLTSLRHDYPLILVDHGSCRGIESLTGVVNRLLQRTAPRGPAGEKTRRRVLRLEQEIRSLIFQKQAGPLSRLWSMAVARLSAQPGLSEEEKQSLQDELAGARSALEIEGEVIGCDADTGDRVMRHLWRRTDEARARGTRLQLEELAIRLHDLLRSDDLHSQESRRPEALRGAFGNHFDDLIDFQAMSRTLCGSRPHARMPAKRRQRIEWALGVLREEKFFGLNRDRYEFVFSSSAEALAEFKSRLPRAADLIKAIRIAALELENGYRDETHDPVFGKFGATSLTVEEIRWFPSYLVSLREWDCAAATPAELIEILSSELPIKLVLQLDHLLDAAKSELDPLASGWRMQLATMAVNLGSAFALQAATSNLCAMAERLTDGLASPGPALFSLFCPGEEAALPPYLAAAAAIESRLFPAMVFDPRYGGSLAECFSLDGNPQPERDWPVHPFTYEDEQMQARTEDLPFTAVDFLAADRDLADAFQPAPRTEWSEEMIPFAEYLRANQEHASGQAPFVSVVGPDDRLQRKVVTSVAVSFARRIARRWRNLQELGGIDNSHARRALDELRQAWESEKRELTEATSTQATNTAIVAAAAAPQLDGKVEPAPPASRDEAWIETPRCTSCNECTKRNNRMFRYNENKQAYIADLRAGTYRELVEAAESCKVAIIHPGIPWNPSEPGLEELLRRAEPFR